MQKYNNSVKLEHMGCDCAERLETPVIWGHNFYLNQFYQYLYCKNMQNMLCNLLEYFFPTEQKNIKQNEKIP